MAKKADLGWLQTKGAVGEAKRRAAADAAQRKEAEKGPRSIILNPADVQGEFDAGRVLMTTLGGIVRPLTASDLATFRRNMRTVQGKLTGTGITAKQVVVFSRARPIKSQQGGSDLTRANEQIRVAVPVFAHVVRSTPGQALDLRFVTNAGPESNVTRHNVMVRFLGFGEAVRALQATPTASGVRDKGAMTPKQAANRLRAGYLAFECDCERHRYFFRYISTIGGFNAGRDETGYPKITNPRLLGVACKHVLRVMSEVNSSSAVSKFVEDALTRAMRAPGSSVTIQHKQQEARAMAAKQQARSRDLEKLSAKLAKATRTPPSRLRSPATRRATKLLKEGRVDELLKVVPFLSEQDRARLQAALMKGNR